MVWAELLRAFKSWSFVLAIVIGLACLGFGLMQYLDGPSDPAYYAKLPPFYNNAYDAVIWSQNSIIMLVVPVLAMLPFADSLVIDRTTGYLRAVLTRTSYKRYVSAKFAACFLSGGVAVGLPLLLFFAYTSLILPRGLNLVQYEQRILSGPNELGPFGALYHIAPDLFILALVVLAFLFGATYAIVGLAVSMFAKNRYEVLATPWLAYFVANFAVGILGLELWSPGTTYSPHWLTNVAWVHLVVGLGGVLLASSLVVWRMSPRLKAVA